MTGFKDATRGNHVNPQDNKAMLAHHRVHGKGRQDQRAGRMCCMFIMIGNRFTGTIPDNTL